MSKKEEIESTIKYNQIRKKLSILEKQPDENIMNFVWLSIGKKQVEQLTDQEIEVFIKGLHQQMQKLAIFKFSPDKEDKLKEFSREILWTNQLISPPIPSKLNFIHIDQHPNSPPSKKRIKELKESIEQYSESFFPLLHDVKYYQKISHY